MWFFPLAKYYFFAKILAFKFKSENLNVASGALAWVCWLTGRVLKMSKEWPRMWKILKTLREELGKSSKCFFFFLLVFLLIKSSQREEMLQMINHSPWKLSGMKRNLFQMGIPALSHCYLTPCCLSLLNVRVLISLNFMELSYLWKRWFTFIVHHSRANALEWLWRGQEGRKCIFI